MENVLRRRGAIPGFGGTLLLVDRTLATPPSSGRLSDLPPELSPASPSEPPRDEITQLLHAWRGGDRDALDRLVPRIYGELRRVADRYLRRERADHTLQPTALVHEAYLRLSGGERPEWRDRVHFFAVAAQMMRRILVDHARAHRADKRGGGARRVSLDEGIAEAVERTADLVALDDALVALAKIDPRKARIIELHYFAGLTVAETAEVLDRSISTVVLDARLARAWLVAELREPANA
ncbi:MAG TPA: sigma-70 family RNA polymerase sigma factor [Thermoanaerobaculia bacterium]|nr:sigma-70 family RNA polymerase sigma factor [Thermoanaerobaculia bacterium]